VSCCEFLVSFSLFFFCLFCVGWGRRGVVRDGRGKKVGFGIRVSLREEGGGDTCRRRRG
jgi:hypothetical protein